MLHNPPSSRLGSPILVDISIAAGRTVHLSEVAGKVNKFGENPTVASGATEDVWDGSIAYVFPATALMTSLSQTVDQAAMRGATIEAQGLDASWNSVTQTKTLDATLTTNVVAWGTPMIRCFRMKVLADVVSTSPIRCHNAGETVDYAIIQTGNNQTLMAIYTIPNGVTGYMTQYYRNFTKISGATPDSVEFSLWAADRDNSYEFQLKHRTAVQNDAGAPVHPFIPCASFTQKTDILMTATSNGAGSKVHSGFDIILVTNP